MAMLHERQLGQINGGGGVRYFGYIDGSQKLDLAVCSGEATGGGGEPNSELKLKPD